MLDTVGKTKNKLAQLGNEASTILFRPRLAGTHSILYKGPYIYSTDDRPELSVESIITDTSDMLNYFALTLIDELARPFMEIFNPHVVSLLIAGPLTDCVPPDLSGIPQFSKDLSCIEQFIRTMKARKWPESERLQQWVSDAPKTWLQRRSNSTLRSVRQILNRGFGRTKAVERVETQRVAADDEVFRDSAPQDDWEASWSDDENEVKEDGTKSVPAANKPSENGSKHADDEDAAGDAWGFGDDDDDDADSNVKEDIQAPKTSDDDDADEAWGWGDDNEQQEQPGSGPSSSMEAKSSGKKAGTTKARPSEREVTLRETYYVTSVPEQILEIVVQVVDDAQSLLGSRYASEFDLLQAAR